MSELVRVFPRMTDEEMARFELLNRAYIDARYKPDYSITREDLEYLASRVTELKALTESSCREKMASKAIDEILTLNTMPTIQNRDEQGRVVNTNLSEVESEIYQVQNESRQDPLNFPIKINNKLAALMNGVSRGDFPPSEQSRQVFERLDGLLQEEMVRIQLIIDQDLARLNELLREEGLDPVLVRRLIS